MRAIDRISDVANEPVAQREQPDAKLDGKLPQRVHVLAPPKNDSRSSRRMRYVPLGSLVAGISPAFIQRRIVKTDVSEYLAADSKFSQTEVSVCIGTPFPMMVGVGYLQSRDLLSVGVHVVANIGRPS